MANMNLENEIFNTGEKYYTLAIYCELNKKWFNEFGDYDKDYVIDEMNHFFETNILGIKRKQMKIIKTTDNQKDIDAAITKLNGEL